MIAPAPADNPKTLFSRDALWQSWLDVEGALAITQAEMGMIPEDAAQEIASRAHLDHFDRDALAADVERTMAPILSLVKALAGTCGREAGGFVHWGATTQNVILAGHLVLMRRAHRATLDHLAGGLDRLAAMAEESAEHVMAGRTNHRHALPITFGFKVAGWIEELLRQDDRFREAEPRIFALTFGGAIGAFHSFGPQGPELAGRLARRLGLHPVLVPSRAAIDGFAEYIVQLALLSMACGRIGQELYRLMADEFGEVAENLGEDVVGSSTMPHKINPKRVVRLISDAALLRAKAAPALEAGLPSHEGDVSRNQVMYALIQESAALGWTVAAGLETTLDGIRLDPERMRANIAHSSAEMTSEKLMMALAGDLGRQHAHDLVHHAMVDAHETGRPLLAVLMELEAVATRFDAEALERLMAPESYTGESARIARDAAALGRKAAAAMRLRARGDFGDR